MDSDRRRRRRRRRDGDHLAVDHVIVEMSRGRSNNGATTAPRSGSVSEVSASNEAADSVSTFWIDLDRLGSLFSHHGSNLYLRIGALGLCYKPILHNRDDVLVSSQSPEISVFVSNVLETCFRRFFHKISVSSRP